MAMDVNDPIDESIRRFENRRKYPALTEEIIKSLSDDDLQQAVLDCIYLKIGDDYNRRYEIITALSDGFRMVYSTWWLEAEIYNGGFNQFFWNIGEFAEEAVDGYVLLGAEEHAKLMQRAIEIFIKEEPRQRRFYIKGTLKAFSESYKHTNLNQLDGEFYKLPDLNPLRVSYIREHPEQFR